MLFFSAQVEAPMHWARIVIALLVASGGAQAVEPALRDGDVLGPSNWQLARDLLPDELLAHYASGDYVNRVVRLEEGKYRSIEFPPDFQAASAANRGLFSLTERGTIVERATGRRPAYIAGLPFPDIDAADPQAATKIVWNFFYSTWYGGDDHFVNELVMLGRGGVERCVTTEVRTRVYDGAAEARGRANPNDLFLQRLARVVSPADLAGTMSLTWRYRDPDSPDSLWSYVPGMRRVRQVNALNRSDGFMGSDISMDDGPFFDSKPEDFTFRLIERREQLVLMDPFSLRGEAELRPVEGGGWRIVWKDVPRIGADDPHWKGLPWAPVSAVLVPRPVWVIEAIPNDPNYLFGRMLLRFDAETYRGSFSSKYDRAGKLLLSYQAASGAFYSPDGGKTYVSAGGIAIRTAENFLQRRATVVLFPPRNAKNPADYHVRSDANLFTPDALVRFGR